MFTHTPRIHQYVFGPVPSRRLGRSLGVDLVPFKTCPFNCVYCQLGRTTRMMQLRSAFVPPGDVLAEVADVLTSDRPRPNFITLSGSGEPTLHSGLGAIIDGICAMTHVPVAVLTNGTLFSNEDVRAACGRAHLVLPTLAATNDEQFVRVHRPIGGASFKAHVDGLVAFRNEQRTPMWLEVFLIEGLNATDDDLERFAALIERIRPDRVQLNTAVRPTAESGVIAASPEKLQRWAAVLGPSVQVIADTRPFPGCSTSVSESAVLDMCRRRPCTVNEIAGGLGILQTDASAYARELVDEGLVRIRWRSGREYFLAC